MPRRSKQATGLLATAEVAKLARAAAEQHRVGNSALSGSIPETLDEICDAGVREPVPSF